MIAYTMVGTTDLPASIQFYDALFRRMGLDLCWQDEQSASWGKKHDPMYPRFVTGYPYDGNPAGLGNGAMTAFTFEKPEDIDGLYQLALSNGANDEGEPGLRTQHGEGFYAAYLRDPDGNKLAFVCYGNNGTQA
ncbi:MAG: VOC family protein [Sphingobium sp.]|nr:VOC family protein [Sphingobium sp.]